MHNYHDARLTFPAGRDGTPSTIPGGNAGDIYNHRNYSFGPQCYVLPFMEQSARYDYYVRISHAGGELQPMSWFSRTTPVEYKDFFSQQIASYLCPSDPEGTTVGYPIMGGTGEAVIANEVLETDSPNARISYATSRGDYYQYYENVGGINSVTIPGAKYSRGMFGPRQVEDGAEEGEGFGLGACADGTSNTLLLSERAVASNSSLPNVYLYPIRGGSIQVGGMTGNPSVCLNARRDGGMQQSDAARGGIRQQVGMFVFDGRTTYNGFNAVFPPNSPSCSADGKTSHGFFSATSYHTGGVNAAYTDASVRFVSDNVDCGNTSIPAPGARNNAGDLSISAPSPYGVWGALGTKDGGESASL